jgi:hypothetical protein
MVEGRGALMEMVTVIQEIGKMFKNGNTKHFLLPGLRNGMSPNYLSFLHQLGIS